MNIGIKAILDTIPQRYPFILIDRVVDLVPEKKIIALKNVTINEPFFMGHFPDTPIMPGVLILEAMGQAGVILGASLKKEETFLYLSGMDKVRFRRPVVPGDQLIIELNVLKVREKAFKSAAKASVDGILAAQAELIGSFGEKP